MPCLDPNEVLTRPVHDRFSGSFAYDFGTDIANWLTSFAPASPAVQECAACFNCKVS